MLYTFSISELSTIDHRPIDHRPSTHRPSTHRPIDPSAHRTIEPSILAMANTISASESNAILLKHGDNTGEPNVRHCCRVVTLELIRKRAEHNDGLLSELVELDLHQDHLESLGPLVGKLCRNIRFLYLHNNVIGSLVRQDWKRLQKLRKLNLALNNIRKIENLQNCEDLESLDVSFNFLSLDVLEESMVNLKSLMQLKELRLQGNPCCTADERSKKPFWANFRPYVIGQLSQLQRLDGEDVNHSERTLANESFSTNAAELKELVDNSIQKDIGIKSYSPQVRTAMSNTEWIKKQQEKEGDPDSNQGENEKMHIEKIESTRSMELSGDTRNCNEGDWIYRFDSESRPGWLFLDLALPKHLSTTWIDADVQPTYISIIIQARLFRTRLPFTVKAATSKAERSQVTGNLLISMPILDADADVLVSLQKQKASDTEESSRSQVKESLGGEILREACIASKEVTDRRCRADSLRHVNGVEPRLEKTDRDYADDDNPPPLF